MKVLLDFFSVFLDIEKIYMTEILALLEYLQTCLVEFKFSFLKEPSLSNYFTVFLSEPFYKYSLYADDCALWHTSNNVDRIQLALDMIKWDLQWCLKFFSIGEFFTQEEACQANSRPRVRNLGSWICFMGSMSTITINNKMRQSDLDKWKTLHDACKVVYVNISGEEGP